MMYDSLEMLDRRIELSIRKGKGILSGLKVIRAAAKKEPRTLDDQKALDSYVNLARRCLIMRRQRGIGRWKEDGLKTALDYNSHLALSCFRLAEHVEGIREVRRFMYQEQINYNPRREFQLMDVCSREVHEALKRAPYKQ